MRFQAYLRVLNDEASIRKLHQETNIPGSVIEPLKARREGTEEVLWQWHSARVDLDGADINSGIKDLLERHRPFFEDIERYRGSEADTYLELVSYHGENEKPRGLYLSSETISVLSELGAGLDNDSVYDVLNNFPKEFHAEK
jgi:uncharacterized protein DUF4279